MPYIVHPWVRLLKQIILVRHGQAENNLPNSMIGGWSDVKLTELGIKQVETIANRLHEDLKDTYKFYSSDLTRAKQTAEIISKKLEINPSYTYHLREFNSGIASGMDRKKAENYLEKVTYPVLDWRPYPESESWREFYHRVTSFMEKINKTDERVLMLTHGGTIQNIIRWWLNTPLSDYFKIGFGVANTSVTVLDTTMYHERRIERLNDTSHYADIGLKNHIE
jgi:broad specificity phosphatase PhoE